MCNFDVAECNLGKVKLEPMLSVVLLICASNLQDGHPWNWKGQITMCFASSEHCGSSLANNICRLIQPLLSSLTNFCRFLSHSLPPISGQGW